MNNRDLLLFGIFSILAFLAVGKIRDGILRFYLKRKHAKNLREAEARWAKRPRCRIAKVGRVTDCGCGSPDCGAKIPKDFEFEVVPHVPPLTCSPKGEMAFFGWTRAEFIEAARNPKEFV